MAVVSATSPEKQRQEDTQRSGPPCARASGESQHGGPSPNRSAQEPRGGSALCALVCAWGASAATSGSRLSSFKQRANQPCARLCLPGPRRTRWCPRAGRTIFSTQATEAGARLFWNRRHPLPRTRTPGSTGWRGPLATRRGCLCRSPARPGVGPLGQNWRLHGLEERWRQPRGSNRRHRPDTARYPPRAGQTGDENEMQ